MQEVGEIPDFLNYIDGIKRGNATKKLDRWFLNYIDGIKQFPIFN